MKKDYRFHWRGLVGGLVLVPLGAMALFSKPVIREGQWADMLVDILAYVCFLSGAAMRFWATLYIGGRKEQEVICHGPYSFCRNPLYLGSFLLAVALGLFLISITFALGLGFTVLFYVWATVPSEEEVLRKRLGTAYERYCEQTPRFLPNFKLFQTPALLEINVQALRRECKRAMLWIWIPVFGELMIYLRDQPWWPHWFSLL